MTEFEVGERVRIRYDGWVMLLAYGEYHQDLFLIRDNSDIKLPANSTVTILEMNISEVSISAVIDGKAYKLNARRWMLERIPALEQLAEVGE